MDLPQVSHFFSPPRERAPIRGRNKTRFYWTGGFFCAPRHQRQERNDRSQATHGAVRRMCALHRACARNAAILLLDCPFTRIAEGSLHAPRFFASRNNLNWCSINLEEPAQNVQFRPRVRFRVRGDEDGGNGGESRTRQRSCGRRTPLKTGPAPSARSLRKPLSERSSATLGTCVRHPMLFHRDDSLA